VSMGSDHSCAVNSNGGVTCWGSNDCGQSTPPGATTPGAFTQVSAGASHSCGLRNDGAAVCWGLNDDGQSTPQSGTFRQVSAGMYYSCGIRDNGTLACWGANWLGETNLPEGASVPGAFREVSAGGQHTCAIRSNGSTVCWGSNFSGESTVPVLTGPGASFNFHGFYPPVERAPAINEVKAGQAIPLKFSLGGDQGLGVIAEGYPMSAAATCDRLWPAGPPEATEPAGQSALSYEPESGWYTYVWKTDQEWSGTCRAMSLGLVDGEHYTAYFRFK
jgi:hypothetical protein